MKATIEQRTPRGKITITHAPKGGVEVSYVLYVTNRRGSGPSQELKVHDREIGMAFMQVMTQLENEVSALRHMAKVLRDTFNDIDKNKEKLGG